MRRILATIATFTMLLVGGLAAASPASALSCTPSVPRATCKVYAIERISTAEHTKGREIGSCKVTRSNSTCTITLATTATRSVQSEFGLSADWVTGKLGISASRTTTISTSCTSPKLRSGEVYRAWVDQTRYRYRIHKYAKGPGQRGLEISGVLTTTQPRANGIICG